MTENLSSNHIYRTDTTEFTVYRRYQCRSCQELQLEDMTTSHAQNGECASCHRFDTLDGYGAGSEYERKRNCIR